MDTVGSYEAKTHLSRLLDRVAKGEQITITKHGVPVAKLVPVGTSGKLDRKAAIEAMKALGKGRSLGIPVRQAIEEGRM